MGIHTAHTEALLGEPIGDGEVYCSKCRYELRSSDDWIEGDNNLIVCGSCYRSFLYPDVNRGFTEQLDSQKNCARIGDDNVSGEISVPTRAIATRWTVCSPLIR